MSQSSDKRTLQNRTDSVSSFEAQERKGRDDAALSQLLPSQNKTPL